MILNAILGKMNLFMGEGLNRLAFKVRYKPFLNMTREVLNYPPRREAYFDELRSFQADWYAFDHGGANIAYAAPEEVPNLCGLSANAITAGLRAIFPRFLRPEVVFGHYYGNEAFPYHYWSAIRYKRWFTWGRQIMIISATQGQFDPRYQNEFVVDYPWNLKNYNLSRYIPNRNRQGSQDTVSFEELAVNEGIIPAIKSIREQKFSAAKIELLERHYRRLVEIIREG